MKRFVAEAKFILLFLVIITAISGLSNFSTDSEKINMTSLDFNREGVLMLHNSDTNNSRSPSSVKDKTATQILERNFFCNHSIEEKKYSEKINNNMTMLSFKICRDPKVIEAVKVVNESNGFRAQIFKSDENKYKTDYIQLNAGSNKIVIDVVLKDGQKISESLVILTGS